METGKEQHVLAGFVHGILCFGHFLGICYNARKGNKIETAIHAGALAFDVISTLKHIKEAKK